MHVISTLLVWVLISVCMCTVDRNSHNMQRIVFQLNSFCLLGLFISLSCTFIWSVFKAFGFL